MVYGSRACILPSAEGQCWRPVEPRGRGYPRPLLVFVIAWQTTEPSQLPGLSPRLLPKGRNPPGPGSRSSADASSRPPVAHRTCGPATEAGVLLKDSAGAPVRAAGVTG